MPRIPKKYMNTSFFHIMVQGINKEYIFNNKKDIEKYLNIIEETNEKIKLQIIAYCVMSNHVHLLIYTDSVEDLTKFMHKVNLLYAKYYNKKYDRVGYVFRDRFKTQPIMTEKHLYCCIDYIHNNPVKANICRKPSEYKYSSYNCNRFQKNELIIHNLRKYIEFIKYNKNNNDNNKEFVFMEIKEDKSKIYSEEIKRYLSENNIDSNQLKFNRILLINLVNKLKNDYNISYRELEKELGISREKIRKLMANYKE